jgi:uncharacterized GH25 family protein
MMKALARCTLAILTHLVACLALSSESVAHDLWLVPTPWMVGPGQPSQLDLVSGIKFPAPDLEEHAYTAEDVARAVIRGPNGSRALSKPQVVKGSLRYENKLTAPGLYCSAAKTKPGFESYSPKEFEEYLEDDGFEQTAKERRRLGETALEGKEFYTQYAATIFRVGKAQKSATSKAPICRTEGQALEILLDSDPTLLAAGDSISFQVVYEGQPTPGAVVRVKAEGDEEDRLTLKTDERGRAQYTLASPGAWVIMVGWMQRRSDRAKADWDTHWATLTFAIPSAGR